MDSQIVKSQYGWYLPTLIERWRGAKSEGVAVDPLSHLVALNRPEAVAELEPIDIDALLYLLVNEEAEEEEEADAAIEPEESEEGEEGEEGEDISSLLSFQVVEAMDIPDVPTIPLELEPRKRRKQSRSNNIIDRFLEVKELRITAPGHESDEACESAVEMADIERPFEIDDANVNEELAKIHMSQKNYEAAKEIYTKLFLLYSEKSVYFAGQLERLSKM